MSFYTKLLDFHAELLVHMIDEDRSGFMRHQHFTVAADLIFPLPSNN